MYCPQHSNHDREHDQVKVVANMPATVPRATLTTPEPTFDHRKYAAKHYSLSVTLPSGVYARDYSLWYGFHHTRATPHNSNGVIIITATRLHLVLATGIT